MTMETYYKDGISFSSQYSKMRVMLDYVSAFRARLWLATRRIKPVYIEPVDLLDGAAMLSVCGKKRFVLIVRANTGCKWRVAYETKGFKRGKKLSCEMLLICWDSLHQAEISIDIWARNRRGDSV